MPEMSAGSSFDGLIGRAVDRRTLLVGAAGTVVAAGLSGPAGALGAPARGRPTVRFDPALAHRLQGILRTALHDPSMHAPGAILHVDSPKLGNWTGAAGLGRVTPRVAMHPRDRFRAGSIIKPFVAVVVLQLAERGRLSLSTPRLPAVMPSGTARRIPHAHGITVRMLLGHRSGVAEWDTPDIDEYIARHPAKIWTLQEILALAAKHPPVFAPGTVFFYSKHRLQPAQPDHRARHRPVVARRDRATGDRPAEPAADVPAHPGSSLDPGGPRPRLPRGQRQDRRCHPHRPVGRRGGRRRARRHDPRRPRPLPRRRVRRPTLPTPTGRCGEMLTLSSRAVRRGRPDRIRPGHRTARPPRRRRGASATSAPHGRLHAPTSAASGRAAPPSASTSTSRTTRRRCCSRRWTKSTAAQR